MMKSASVPRIAASRADSLSSSARTSSRSYNVRGCELNRCTSGPASTCEICATYEPLPWAVWMIWRARSTLSPSRSAVRDTPSFSVSRRSDGRACPALSTPSRISRSIRSATTSAICLRAPSTPGSMTCLTGMTTISAATCSTRTGILCD
ncbi:Uncharacterised protein [Bordetella pertussis]|nr:Uncharacterised protein [Bordetella pertussis]CFP59421.1 Uncharacterised protein [Bordetella pertussis]